MNAEDAGREGAGREMDAAVAEKVMGWRLRLGTRDIWMPPGATDDTPTTWLPPLPRYSHDLAAAWDVVVEVQHRNPGWRFSLLGGDVSYASGRNEAGEWAVDRSRTVAFGWVAEFMGHVDPERDYGDRHGRGRADTPALAICRAALAALSPTLEERDG